MWNCHYGIPIWASTGQIWVSTGLTGPLELGPSRRLRLPGVGDCVAVGLGTASGGWLPPCPGWSWRGTEVLCHVGVGVLRLGDYNGKASR
jgi:hypothetical protein